MLANEGFPDHKWVQVPCRDGKTLAPPTSCVEFQHPSFQSDQGQSGENYFFDASFEDISATWMVVDVGHRAWLFLASAPCSFYRIHICRENNETKIVILQDSLARMLLGKIMTLEDLKIDVAFFAGAFVFTRRKLLHQ